MLGEKFQCYVGIHNARQHVPLFRLTKIHCSSERYTKYKSHCNDAPISDYIWIPTLHNWPFQLFDENYSLDSHTTHVGRTYSIKSTLNDRFLRNFFMADFYLISEFLPEKCIIFTRILTLPLFMSNFALSCMERIVFHSGLAAHTV